MKFITTILFLLAAPDPTTLPPGTQLTYEGTFVADRGEQADSEKRFMLSLLVGEWNGGQPMAYWTLQELGRGGWSWLHHFGKLPAGKDFADITPTLLHERPEGTNVIPLLPPLLVRDEPLASGVQWAQGKLEHHVKGTAQVGDVETWEVEARNAFGVKRTLWVDQRSPLVLALREKVFIGQGEEHELRYQLLSRSTLDETALAATTAAFDGFIALRNRLQISQDLREVAWTEARLALLREQLPRLLPGSTTGLLAQVATDAGRDAKEQRDRADSVAALQARLVGRDAPHPKLTDMHDKDFSWSVLQNKVTLLHFWEYRNTPLEEPYGQIAYVDYLLRNRTSEDLQVFGVVVHQQLEDHRTRQQVMLGARALKSFMNLSYPLLFDHADAIKQFGDPRVAGAKLPLFVVVGRDGKIVHYHAGAYEVDRDAGLKQLEGVIKVALESRE